MDNIDTRERELRGIQDAMNTYHLSEGFIITNSHEEEIDCKYGIVHILPAWKWLKSVDNPNASESL